MDKRYAVLGRILCLILSYPVIVQGQSFQTGVLNYKQYNFKQAVSIFKELQSPQARLFTAKSYYALHRFDKAEDILNNLFSEATPRIYYEAIYTSALVDYQQKQFGSALSKLFIVFNKSKTEALGNEANELYNQILGYLTADQRLNAMETIDQPQVKYQLVNTALGRVSFASIQKLITAGLDRIKENKWRQKVTDLQASLSSEAAYKIQYGEDYRSFTPPKGTMIHIGIALPKVKTDKPTYSVVQGLFLGAKLATRQFNQKHDRAKVYIQFLPMQSKETDNIVEGFATKQSGEVIIGPLFSDQAKQMIPLSGEYNIPVVAPLATSNLSAKGSLFYQANSTFSIHGSMMATYAVNELNLHTFAIIASPNTNGAASAKAFRKQAKALGANVISFKLKKFKKSGYNTSSYIKKMGDKLSQVDAIYAPFTQNYTPLLVEKLIYAVNKLQNPITLLGSQKWSDINFSTDIYSRGAIYFSTNAFIHGRLTEFRNNYSNSFKLSPNKYAIIGYDVAHYLLQLLDKVGNISLLNNAIQEAPFYRGLFKNFYFNGSNVNHAVQMVQVSNGQLQLQQWQPSESEK